MSNYTKLKTNLKLAIQRLKLLEKKKTELSLKSRKEIADYIQMNKADRARIRVEHIIREDNYVEAMEMLEMYCDLLLARFGLIEKMKELDPGLDEAIATVLWTVPRISSDIQEFKIIGDMLTFKYGKKYADACKTDALGNVNDKVKRRLGLEAPSKLLVEQYLIEIAKNFNVPFEPDQNVMLRSGHIDEELINLKDQATDLIGKYGNDGNGSGGGASAPSFSADLNNMQTFYNHSEPIGFNVDKKGMDQSRDLINLDENGAPVVQNDLNNNTMLQSHPNEKFNGGGGSECPYPLIPNVLPVGDVNENSGEQQGAVGYAAPPLPPPAYQYDFDVSKHDNNKANNDSGYVNVNSDQNFNLSTVNNLPPYSNDAKHVPTSNVYEPDSRGFDAPPLPSKNDLDNSATAFDNNSKSRPPSYNQSEKQQQSHKIDFNDFDLNLPGVPDVNPGGGPANSTSTSNNQGDTDFDELTRRFENLKKK